MLYEVFCKIEGISPILFHRFADIDDVQSNMMRPKQNKNQTPLEIAMRSAYIDDKGELYYPSRCMMAAIVDAGKHTKIGKSKVTTAKSTTVYGGLEILEENLYFGTKAFETDSRVVTNASTGGKVLSHRAKLPIGWQLSFSMRIDSEVFDIKIVEQLIKDAGTKCGIGEYRPNRKGPFGRFIIKELERKN